MSGLRGEQLGVADIVLQVRGQDPRRPAEAAAGGVLEGRHGPLRSRGRRGGPRGVAVVAPTEARRRRPRPRRPPRPRGQHWHHGRPRSRGPTASDRPALRDLLPRRLQLPETELQPAGQGPRPVLPRGLRGRHPTPRRRGLKKEDEEDFVGVALPYVRTRESPIDRSRPAPRRPTDRPTDKTRTSIPIDYCGAAFGESTLLRDARIIKPPI
mmetsp:Transcript_1342/g.4576  ORF Transcript_1342/g.4576 Transcript_1342/m.4576 type:complete len:211 (-) Transcript_1342:33-665(-)